MIHFNLKTMVSTITKIMLMLCLPVIASAQLNSDSMATVTFIVKTKLASDSDSVFISGNHQLLGNWHPGKITLSHDLDKNWKRVFVFKKNTSLKFKFTRGDWKKEAIYKTGEIPDDTNLLVQNDTTLQINIPFWRDDENIETFSGQITGKVNYHSQISADGLKPRDLIVWLPPGYDQDTTRYYAVLYMHDGQNIFDPATSAFGIDWQLDETADSLITANVIEPIIIVGIYNTIDRSREYMETEMGKKYMDLVVNIIKPMIDKLYRTKPERESTAVGGSSAGGLVSFMLLWEYSEIFSRAACLSPVFKYTSETTDIDYVENVVDAQKKKPDFFLYLNNSDDELDRKLEPGIEDLVSALKKKGYQRDREFVWHRLTNSKHGESFWGKSSVQFLKIFFPAVQRMSQ